MTACLVKTLWTERAIVRQCQILFHQLEAVMYQLVCRNQKLNRRFLIRIRNQVSELKCPGQTTRSRSEVNCGKSSLQPDLRDAA